MDWEVYLALWNPVAVDGRSGRRRARLPGRGWGRATRTRRTNGQLNDHCPPTLAITGLCWGSAWETKAEVLCNLAISRSRWVSLGRRFYRADAVQPVRKIVDFIYVPRSNRLTKRQRVSARRGNFLLAKASPAVGAGNGGWRTNPCAAHVLMPYNFDRQCLMN